MTRLPGLMRGSLPRLVRAALMFAGAASAQPFGVIYEQDFETCTAGKLPEHWRVWQRGDTTVTFTHPDREAAHSGAQSVSMGNMTGSRAEWVLELPLPEGVRDIHATVWVKTAGPEGADKGGPLRLELSDPDNNWRVLGTSQSITQAPQWQQLEAIVSVPAGSKRLALELLCLGSFPGKVWLDDVEVRAITELPVSVSRQWRPSLGPEAAEEVPPRDAVLGVSLPFLSAVPGSLADEARYRCRVQVLDGKGKAVAEAQSPVREGMAEVKLAKLPPGEATAVIQVLSVATGGVAAENRQAIRVLTEAEAGRLGKRLNNLVVELVARRVKLQPGVGMQVPFALARDSWVYLAARPLAPEAQPQMAVPGLLDGQPLPLTPVGAPPMLETMRWLPRGQQQVTVTAARATETEVVVRTVPEILFENFSYPPWIKAYGPFDRAFLDRHVLPHVNTVTIHSVDSYAADLADLRRLGKKWLWHVGVPGMTRMSERGRLKTEAEIAAFEAALKTEDVAKTWAGPGMTHPDLGGDLADEFFDGMGKDCAVYGEAVDRLSNQFPDRQFYAYCALTPQSADCIRFLENLRQRGGRFAYESYAYSQPTEETARQHLLDRFVRPAVQWEAGVPGAHRSMVYVISTMNTIGALTLQYHPEVDWKVHADMQFALMARHPEFRGLYGIGNFTSGYMTDEELRWLGQLYRHYGIEGHREPLSAQYGYRYLPGHLQNGDFVEGLKEWKVLPAAVGSVRADTHAGYGIIQGRYCAPSSVGASFLVLKRSTAGPNVVRQKLTGLTPGRTYMLRFVVADLADLKSGQSKGKAGQRYTLVPTVADATVVPEQSFVYVSTSSRLPQAPFVGANPFCLNLQQVVFRPTRAEVELRLSDWASAAEAGGPADQELIVNYMQVQPYFEGK